MKLILSISFDEKKYEQIEIINGKLEEIDKFTTGFKNKEDLFEKLFEDLKVKDRQKIKYRFYLESKERNIKQVLYSDYSFMTDKVSRKRVSRKLKYLDPKRIYEYIENNYYYLLYKDMDKKYNSNPLYKLSLIIEKKEYKPDSEYYYVFTKEIENKYGIVRDLVLHVLTKEELTEFYESNQLPNTDIQIVSNKINDLYDKYLKHESNEDCSNILQYKMVQ